MGNFNSSAKFDIIVNLPPELILLVLSYLSITDVTHCLLVCRMWHEIISDLGPYWNRAAARMVGMSVNAVVRCASSFSTPRDFFIAARKNKHKMKSIKFSCAWVDFSLPTNLQFTHCLYARDGTMARVQKINCVNQNQSNQLVVERVSDYGLTKRISSVSSLLLHPHSRIAWAYASNKHLFWVTRSGVWNGFDLQSNTQLFQWEGHLLKNGEGVAISCCKQCFLAVAVHWESCCLDQNAHHSTHSMQIMSLGEEPREVVNWKVCKVSHNHSVFVNHDSRYWIRETFVLSETSVKHNGVCKQHRIVLQSDCCTLVQSLKMDVPKVKLTEPECINCCYSMEYREIEPSSRDRSSEVVFSSDKLLMGMIFDHDLYTWKWEDTPKLINVASLPQLHTCNVVKLVALGHLYAIIAYLFDTHLMEYQLCIVSVQTGEIFAEYRKSEKFYDWKFCCHIDPLHKFYFMCDGSHGQDWLNDIHCRSGSIITLHNHNGKIHFESISLNSRASQSWRRHWRCIVK